MASGNIGRVIQVIGPVVDIEFPKGVPAIYNAVTIEGGNLRVVVEVEQHLGEDRVRCVAMQPTDGMVRGMKAVDTGAAIMVPVGPGTLGRVLNVLGEPVDQCGAVKCDKKYTFNRPAPAFDDTGTLPAVERCRPHGQRRDDCEDRGQDRRGLQSSECTSLHGLSLYQGHGSLRLVTWGQARVCVSRGRQASCARPSGPESRPCLRSVASPRLPIAGCRLPEEPGP